MLISASNSKARLCLWYRACNTNSFILHEEIPIPPAQIPKSINLMNCPCRGSQRTPSVLLAIGSVDSRVHLRLLNIINTNEIMTFSKSTIVGLLSGHEDWVTCLSEPYYLPHKTAADTSDLYFASGSQDSKIRIWKITPSMLTLDKESKFSNSQTELKYEEPNEIDDDDEPEEEEEEGDTETQKNTVGVVSEENTGEARCAFMASQFTCDAGSLNEFLLFSVTLETLLVGHEDWVTSLHWMSCSTNVTSSELSLRLFSTSMDRNMVVWSPDPSDGIWSPTIRIGDIGGNLGGSVGGNLLGFVGGCTMVTKNENDLLVESILGIGFGGSFHLWQRVMNGDPQGDIWKPRSFLTGHFGAVTDVTWSNCPDDVSSITNNEFIITVSQDQTCRLFAPVKIAETSDMNSWAEVSRPQVCLCFSQLIFLRFMAIIYPVFPLFHLIALHLLIFLVETKKQFVLLSPPQLFSRVFPFLLTIPLLDNCWNQATQ